MSSAVAQNPDRKPTPAPVRVFNERGRSRIVLVCEHASNHIPETYKDLGLSEAQRSSHAAWDIGACALSEMLSENLDAVLVTGTISRLVYDCNRPPSAPDAMPAKSEVISIPGNLDITDEERKHRVETVYEPFRKTLGDTLRSRPEAPILITVHSFTPVYFGKYREVEIGIIHDEDDSLAKTIVHRGSAVTQMKFALNEPYSRADGVAHTLAMHGTENGLTNAMIEVRNDLLETPEQQTEIAKILGRTIRESLSELRLDSGAGVWS